jgi:hypothetical protein
MVRVLTLKEVIGETRPLVLDQLLKIPGNFYVVTEWTPLSMNKARKEITKRRRHFNVTKTSFVSQVGNDGTKINPRDVLVDESKQHDANYADLSFFFTILAGEKHNAHLDTEYLAVLETDNATPYFLNLHNGEVPHTLILGMTGSGKCSLHSAAQVVHACHVAARNRCKSSAQDAHDGRINRIQLST